MTEEIKKLESELENLIRKQTELVTPIHELQTKINALKTSIYNENRNEFENRLKENISKIDGKAFKFSDENIMMRKNFEIISIKQINAVFKAEIFFTEIHLIKGFAKIIKNSLYDFDIRKFVDGNQTTETISKDEFNKLFTTAINNLIQ